MINKGRVRLLVAALKSGEYQKTTGKLHRTAVSNFAGGLEEGWCCLGVASDLAHKFGVPVNREQEETFETFDGEASYMPATVMQWYGFEKGNPTLNVNGRQIPAAAVNDSGYLAEDGELVKASLADIGNFFRDTYLKKQKQS